MKKLLLLIATVVSTSFAHAQNKEVIEYRAQVWAEKSDVERYGGEKVFWHNMQQMFENTNYFFNESDNKFDYYFKFLPAGLKIYDIAGNKENYKAFEKEAYGVLDTAKYDFVVFFALDAEGGGLWCGGGGKSRQAVVCCYQTLADQQKEGGIFGTAPPKQGTYSNLGHEYGHVRGASDIYQYIISAKDNPVNGQALMPPKCNMGNGMWAWSDYCSEVFNHTARHKQLPAGWVDDTFPDSMQVTVYVKGKVKKDVPVKFYGTRAGGSKNNRDVYPTPYRTFRSDKNGNVIINSPYTLYHPNPEDTDIPPKEEFPYWYWFSFLVEAEYKGEKQYVWVPDWATQISKLQGKNIHDVTFNFN